MKTVRNSLVWLAASAVMCGAAPAQDKSASFDQGVFINYTVSVPWHMKTEPGLVLGSNARLTGLLVDGIQPRQTWNLLNPFGSVGGLPKPAPQSRPSVEVPRLINDPAAHEPDFPLLRLNFP